VEQVAEARLAVVGVDRPDTGTIRFLGRISEEDKRAELGRAAILAAPNRGGESFGIVVIEGLAAGCAVVASDLEAFRAVAGNSAVYVPTGDSGALAAAIVRIAGDEEARSVLVEAGSAQVQRYGREAVLGAYRDAYRTAIAGL
jgi:phosphatidylinositol alpha-mannosyltransferase